MSCVQQREHRWRREPCATCRRCSLVRLQMDPPIFGTQVTGQLNLNSTNCGLTVGRQGQLRAASPLGGGRSQAPVGHTAPAHFRQPVLSFFLSFLLFFVFFFRFFCFGFSRKQLKAKEAQAPPPRPRGVLLAGLQGGCPPILLLAHS